VANKNMFTANIHIDDIFLTNIFLANMFYSRALMAINHRVEHG
jgi:hypothetical protein